MKHAAKTCCDAHIFVMKNIKPTHNEAHIGTMFRFLSRFWDHSAFSAYHEIVGTGSNAAILHYHANNKDCKDGDVLLMDAGVRLNNYCSDLTTSFPVNGKFTERQKGIYNAVLECNRGAIKRLTVGQNYQDLHHWAEKFFLVKLIELGLIREPEVAEDNKVQEGKEFSAYVEELWTKRVIYYFFPHGLGHYIGTYTHDLPGDPRFENERKQVPQQNLRIARRLKHGMVVTIEPGIYFIPLLLKQAKNKPEILKFLNFEIIDKFAAEVQGVRVEDMVHVRNQGAEILSDFLPRTVEDIEGVMSGELNWPGAIDYSGLLDGK